MRRRNTSSKKAKNQKVQRISKLLLECDSWALLNIKMVLNGYELDEDVILILIHLSFIEFNANSFYAYDDYELKKKMRNNAHHILIEICKNKNVELNENMISTILKKVIFTNTAEKFTKEELHEMLMSLIQRNPEAVKTAYNQYSMFAKYKV